MKSRPWLNELNISVSRQVHCSNAPADSPKSYCCRNIIVPFLDHITLELEERFEPIHQTKAKLLGPIPSVAATYSIASIAEVGALYSADLPSPRLLSPEFSCWKRACVTALMDKRPDTLEKALLFYDRDDCPNILVLLVIACTLLATTCETERSNSQLKTYLHVTMT